MRTALYLLPLLLIGCAAERQIGFHKSDNCDPDQEVSGTIKASKTQMEAIETVLRELGYSTWDK